MKNKSQTKIQFLFSFHYIYFSWSKIRFTFRTNEGKMRRNIIIINLKRTFLWKRIKKHFVEYIRKNKTIDLHRTINRRTIFDVEKKKYQHLDNKC